MIVRTSYQSFRFLDMLMSEQELAVQVAQVDGVEIDNVGFTEASEDEVLQKLTADTASTNHQDSRL